MCCRERSQTWISPIFTGCEQAEIKKILPAIRSKPHHDERSWRFNRHFRPRVPARPEASCSSPSYILRIAYPRFTNNDIPHFSNFSLAVSTKPYKANLQSTPPFHFIERTWNFKKLRTWTSNMNRKKFSILMREKFNLEFMVSRGNF